MDFFVYDAAKGRLRVEEYSILLVKEFGDLWELDRNKCKEDKTGKERLLAFKELAYIFLVLDFKSPYAKYTPQQKHKEAMRDTGLTEENLQDEKFKAAFRKYNDIQNSDPILSIINTAYGTLHKMQVFYDNIDFNNDVDAEGRPLYKPKDVLTDLASLATTREKLMALEDMHKKGLAESGKKVRGDAEIGYDEM